ncbi:MAG: hypothetical protein ACLP4R_00635 [Solirubrobacteraceae bacterium]
MTGITPPAVLVAFRREYKADFNPFPHVVLPLLGIVTFGIPLVGTFYPVPAAPYSWLPYIVLGWLVIGIIVALWLGRYRAGALSRIGRIFTDPLTARFSSARGWRVGP